MLPLGWVETCWNMLKLPMISTELVSEMIQHVDLGMIFYIYLLFLGVGLKKYVTHEPLAFTI